MTTVIENLDEKSNLYEIDRFRSENKKIGHKQKYKNR